MTEAIEKSAMTKIYMRLLPFAILSYFLAYVDRINVSFAALTMRDDLQMSASAYGFALGTFYWAYFIFEVPSNSEITGHPSQKHRSFRRDRRAI